MKSCTWKSLPLAIAGAVMLSACTGDATRSDVADEAQSTQSPYVERAPTHAPSAKSAPATVTTTPAPTAVPQVEDDELVGVEACDDYLESYRSCHSVAGIYEPDTIQARYQVLRARLVDMGRDPASHEALKLQCSSLADDMKTTLDGRDCPDLAPVADVDLDDDIDGDDVAESALEDAIEDEADSP